MTDLTSLRWEPLNSPLNDHGQEIGIQIVIKPYCNQTLDMSYIYIYVYVHITTSMYIYIYITTYTILCVYIYILSQFEGFDQETAGLEGTTVSYNMASSKNS